MDKIAPTPYQARCLAVPETYNLFLGGGRGGGKSYGALLLVLRHVEQYSDRARPLIVRETYKLRCPECHINSRLCRATLFMLTSSAECFYRFVDRK